MTPAALPCPDIEIGVMPSGEAILPQSGARLCDPVHIHAKSCGRTLGKVRPPAIRSGTGRGGDVTGSRISVVAQRSLALAVAMAGRLSPSETQTFGSLCDWRFTNR